MLIPGHPRIDVDPAICGGKPRVAGTRMRVVDVVRALAAGDSEDELLTDFPYISREDIRACLAFVAEYAEHPIVMAQAAE